MKDVEIHRMNFLHQAGGAFSYKKMGSLFIGWCVLLMSLYGLQVGKQYYLARSVDKIKKNIDSLNEQKDKQIKFATEMNQKSVGASAQNDLTQVLLNRPVWSTLLHYLTHSVPPHVELDSISVLVGEKGSMLEVTGKAKSQKDVTAFIMQIESSGYFNHTSLIKSKHGEGTDTAFYYEINTFPILGRSG